MEKLLYCFWEIVSLAIGLANHDVQFIFSLQVKTYLASVNGYGFQKLRLPFQSMV